MSYQVIFSQATLQNADQYRRALLAGAVTPGQRLGALLEDAHPPSEPMQSMEHLLQTKMPKIFAESAVAGDGRDWNATELHLLGDMSIATDVEIFDDGSHANPEVHPAAFTGTLVFVCGALLRNGYDIETPDLKEVAPDGHIDESAYIGLYRRRLAPVFAYIDGQAQQRGRNALVTIPGLGCGQFAGPFQGALGTHLQTALAQVLSEQRDMLTHIRAVVFDPFNECQDHTASFGCTEFRVRPLRNSKHPNPQLCAPPSYQEADDDFDTCDLYSLVAWDQVSWPGNDFYAGLRSTDDGVKAAATSAMHAVTGIEGHYDPQSNQYRPPQPFNTWLQVVEQHDLKLSIGRPFVFA